MYDVTDPSWYQVPSEEDACVWHRLAYQRHLDDLERQHEEDFEYYFDYEYAQHAVDFTRYIKHFEGEWAGQPFELSPYQVWHFAVLYGWRRKDDPYIRRFTICYNELPRKNGKSFQSSSIGLYELTASGEMGNQVVCAATKFDQAKIIHGSASKMAMMSPRLNKMLKIHRNNISFEQTFSRFFPLSGDAKKLDGLNLGASLIDELHAHPNRELLDVILTARGARRSPLVYIITTAGFDRQSVCFDYHTKAKQVLEGVIKDDNFFAFIATIDEGDDPHDPKSWRKANPNFGYSLYEESFKEESENARQMPSALNSFLRLRLNVWTQQDVRWLSMAKWRECERDYKAALEEFIPEELKGRECFAGLDLASVEDIASLGICFPDYYYNKEKDQVQIERVRSLSFNWCPEGNFIDHQKRSGQDYTRWAREGILFGTPGNVIDYDRIRLFINLLQEIINFKECAVDRWNAQQIMTQLDGDGLTVVPMGQGYASMSGPTKELQAFILSQRFEHNGNEVLTWAASNLSVEEDAAGNIKPSKKTSVEKIDPMVAMIMAVACMIVAPKPKKSVYKSRGIVSW